MVANKTLGEAVVATVKRYWRKCLWIIGTPTALDLLREFFRGRLMDWSVAHLGVLGKYLAINPVALFTLGVVVALTFIAGAVVVEELKSPQESTILGEHARPYQRPRNNRWVVGVVVFALFAVGLVVYGTKRYMTLSPSAKVSRREIAGTIKANQGASPGNQQPTPLPEKPTIQTLTNDRKSEKKKPTAQPRSPQAAPSPPSVNQNCPGGMCATGDINGSLTIINPTPPPPTVTWTKDNQQEQPKDAPRPVTWGNLLVDHPFTDAKFAVVCDRPCSGYSFMVNGMNNICRGELPKGVAAFIIRLPNPFPPNIAALFSVESDDDKPVRIVDVKTLVLADDSVCQ